MELEKLPLNTTTDALVYALQAHLNGATGSALTLIPFDAYGRRLYAKAAWAAADAENAIGWKPTDRSSRVAEVLRLAIQMMRFNHV